MKKEDPPLLIFSSINELMQRLGLPGPAHPFVALINHSDIKMSLADAGTRFSLDFYKISFKTRFDGRVKYGPGHYDFNNGGLAFLAPRQIVTMSDNEESYEGYSLFFHPDLIKGYQLGNDIANFGFFSYGISEALYLSEKEKQVVSSLFEAIEKELDNSTDLFSQDILVSQIELLLNHSNRFYNRQFITRRMIYTLLSCMYPLLRHPLSWYMPRMIAYHGWAIRWPITKHWLQKRSHLNYWFTKKADMDLRCTIRHRMNTGCLHL